MSASKFGKCLLGLAFALILAVIPACDGKREEDSSPFVQKEVGYVLAVDVDVSGSFANDLEAAWTYMVRVIEAFFRGRNTANDAIILSQISGSPNSILFSGSPSQFKQRFKSAAEFKKAFQGLDGNASRVHSSLADTLDAVVRLKPKRSLIVVLSDMEDSEPGSTPRLTESLRKYGKDGKAGNIACYWVEPKMAEPWKNVLSVAVKHHEVHDKNTPPNLPQFDD